MLTRRDGRKFDRVVQKKWREARSNTEWEWLGNENFFCKGLTTSARWLSQTKICVEGGALWPRVIYTDGRTKKLNTGRHQVLCGWNSRPQAASVGRVYPQRLLFFDGRLGDREIEEAGFF
mgnify:FL=1